MPIIYPELWSCKEIRSLVKDITQSREQLRQLMDNTELWSCKEIRSLVKDITQSREQLRQLMDNKLNGDSRT